MLLLYIAFSCVFIGSSTGIKTENKCYGGEYRLPLKYTPPLFSGRLYFTPSKGGPRTLLTENGKVKDPRLRIFLTSVSVSNLRERDDGVFSVELQEGRIQDVIKLHVLDCANEITRTYGYGHFYDVPRQAEFLEFSPGRTVDEPKVLWNRSDPQSMSGTGQIKRGVWEIIAVTQADNGYYNFRKKDNTLLSRILLKVQENIIYYNPKVNDQLVIQNPFIYAPWTVTFTPKRSTEPQTLMSDGHMIRDEDGISRHFSGRISVVSDGLEIYPVESTDSGTFEFRDTLGNLAQTVKMDVEQESTPTFVLVAVIVGIIFGVIVCCCCVRKCCCKKSSSKRDESAAQTAAAPAVYYHDMTQGPSYLAAPAPDYHSHQTTTPLLSRDPATTSLGPSVNNPSNIHMSPQQPEVTAPAGHGAAPAPSLDYNCLSSDPEPKFELKGVIVSSAGPLSTDSTFSDVYTSDKLNFL